MGRVLGLVEGQPLRLARWRCDLRFLFADGSVRDVEVLTKAPTLRLARRQTSTRSSGQASFDLRQQNDDRVCYVERGATEEALGAAGVGAFLGWVLSDVEEAWPDVGQRCGAIGPHADRRGNSGPTCCDRRVGHRGQHVEHGQLGIVSYTFRWPAMGEPR